jgi:hypothetical protein
VVDFNSDATVAVPAYDILRVLILQRRDAFIEALEAYYRTKYKGLVASTYEVRARLRSLFEEVRASMIESIAAEDMVVLLEQVHSPDFDCVLKAWRTIDEWLYDKKLTQFDSRIRYDSTRVEDENRMKNIT